MIIDNTTSVHEELLVECARSGTNLTKVCKRAGVDRSTVSRWATKEPNSFDILKKLLVAIEAERNESPRYSGAQL